MKRRIIKTFFSITPIISLITITYYYFGNSKRIEVWQFKTPIISIVFLIIILINIFFIGFLFFKKLEKTKKLIAFFLSISLYSTAQTIEKKYNDFELITNVKSVTEIQPIISNLNQVKSIETISLNKLNLDQLFTNPVILKKVNVKYFFDDNGFIHQNEKYYSGDKTTVRIDYIYNKENKLIEEVSMQKEDNNNSYLPYYTTKIERENNTVTKTTKYIEEDTIYSEKFIVENDLIIEEKTPYTNSIISKYSYNEKNQKIKGELTLANGEKLTWTDEYEYFPNGKIKTKINYTAAINQTITEEYFKNGLIKTEKFKDKISAFYYHYDHKGNWIYKIEYKNEKLNSITKREIVYY